MHRIAYRSGLFRNVATQASAFANLAQQPADAILSLRCEFEHDNNPNKIYLGVGELLVDSGELPCFNSVQMAEQKLWSDGVTSKKYTPILGRSEFHKCFGDKLTSAGFDINNNSFAVTPGGTGALSLASQLLKRLKTPRIWVPDMTWPNHVNIFGRVLEVVKYSYLTPDNKIDLESIGKLEIQEGDSFLVHACCHNPTGVDMSCDEVTKLIDILASTKAIPLLDSAYIGLANGLKQDLERVRLWHSRFDNIITCYSFSKNMGLYGQRVGMLQVQPEVNSSILSSNLALDARALWSNPPCTGALIAEEVLNNTRLFNLWSNEISIWSDKLRDKRIMLASKLQFDADYISRGKGLFTYVRLDKAKCEALKKSTGVYLVNLGSISRLNICAVSESNVDYVAGAINSFV